MKRKIEFLTIIWSKYQKCFVTKVKIMNIALLNYSSGFILPSSAKPSCQPQLPAAAKLAELQPYFAFHLPTHPHPHPCQQILSCSQAKLPAQTTAGLVNSPSQLVASSQLVGSPLKQASCLISSTKYPFRTVNFELLIS